MHKIKQRAKALPPPMPWLVKAGAILTASIAGTIAVLTLSPLPEGASLGNDKIYHILAFAALVFPLSYLLAHYCLWFMAMGFAYGVAIEIIQPFVGRSAELGDVWADLLGAALGALAGYLCAHITHRRLFKTLK